eukprot:1049686-Rhodomonas_salina.3
MDPEELGRSMLLVVWLQARPLAGTSAEPVALAVGHDQHGATDGDAESARRAGAKDLMEPDSES